jgi:site-specific DNA recombinase
MQKNAIMYCRVSTKEQVEEGNSLASQEKYCKEYIAKNSDSLLESFIEQGESAKTAHRTQLKALLKYCASRKNKVDYVVVYKIDRIARNIDDYSAIRITLKQCGVEIRSTSEFFEDTPAGRFMENIIANVAQFDNDVRTERSLGGMRDAMREGRYVWNAPIGYKNAKIAGKSNIVQDQYAPLILELFQKVSLDRYTIADIRTELNAKGLANKLGKALSKSQYYRLLRNKVYAGWITEFKETHRGLYEPIISDQLFEQVQRVLRKRKTQGGGYEVENPDFPLRRFFRHPSGIQLTGSWAKGKRKKYPYYNYHLSGCNYPKKRLDDLFKELLNKHALNAQHYKELKAALKQNLDKQTGERQKLISLTNQKIKDLKQRQQLLIDKNLKGTISDTVLKAQLEITEQDLLDANSCLLSMEGTSINFERLLDYASELLINPGNAWENASIHQKRKLQVFYFPDGIVFDGIKSQTPKICSIFKAKTLFLSGLSQEVPFAIRKANKPFITRSDEKENSLINKGVPDAKISETTYHENRLWNSIAQELVYLSNLKKGES